MPTPAFSIYKLAAAAAAAGKAEEKLGESAVQVGLGSLVDNAARRVIPKRLFAHTD